MAVDIWTKNYLLLLVQEGKSFHVQRAIKQFLSIFLNFQAILMCFGKLKGGITRFSKGKVGFWGDLDLALKFIKVFVQRSTTLCHLLCCQIHENGRKSISFFSESEMSRDSRSGRIFTVAQIRRKLEKQSYFFAMTDMSNHENDNLK